MEQNNTPSWEQIPSIQRVSLFSLFSVLLFVCPPYVLWTLFSKTLYIQKGDKIAPISGGRKTAYIVIAIWLTAVAVVKIGGMLK